MIRTSEKASGNPGAGIARYGRLQAVLDGDFDGMQENRDPQRVREVLDRGVRTLEHLALLLSPGAEPVLETLAERASAETRRQFGRTVQFYAPLYVSDHCVNQCTYCGFRADNSAGRSRLEPEALGRQTRWLTDAGYRNLLLVAGESRRHCSPAYLEQAVRIVSEEAPLVGIEVYPLEEDEYRSLHLAGAEYLTLYQETYDRETYGRVHPSGPKADFGYRLGALELGCRAGFNAITLGVLLGLAPWRRDLLAMAAQGEWLERRYPGTRVGYSLPRLRPAAGMAPPAFEITDRQYVQALLALRLWSPTAELSLSTRERQVLRDGLIPLAISKVSAGSCTAVGGYGRNDAPAEQFQISDDRTLREMMEAVRSMGLDPVLNDWVPLRGAWTHG